jgi:sugar/nucleoside kinase (ribokinase family)
VTVNHQRLQGEEAMTATLDTLTDVASGTVSNARGEEVFLRAQDYTLTARQIVLALAAHLAQFGDTLHVQVVDPLAAIDAHMRFTAGHLTAWAIGRTPADVAAIRARAEAIARDYFGHQFPAVPW